MAMSQKSGHRPPGLAEDRTVGAPNTPVTRPAPGQPQGGGGGLGRMGKAQTVKTKGARASQMRGTEAFLGCWWHAHGQTKLTWTEERRFQAKQDPQGFRDPPGQARPDTSAPTLPQGSSISTPPRPPSQSIACLHLEDMSHVRCFLLFQASPPGSQRLVPGVWGSPIFPWEKLRASLFANQTSGDRTKQRRLPADCSFPEALTTQGRSRCPTSATCIPEMGESRLLSVAQRPTLCC